MDAEFLAGLLSLEGRVAVVTGARQGIGQAIAVGVARAGARVVITSRDENGTGRTADQIRELGQSAVEFRADVRSIADCRMVVQGALDAFGRLDVLVNNAGVAITGPALDYPEEAWDNVIDTSLKGSFLMSQAAAPAMATGGGGRVINLSSTFARRPYLGRAAYSSAKAGLEQLTRVLALEWAAQKITVNAIALTTIITQSRAHAFTDLRAVEKRISEIPMGRLGRVEDAVGAALYLAGPAGEFVTGHTLLVDGGFTLA